MNKTIIRVIAFLALLFLVGCQEQTKTEDTIQGDNSVNTITNNADTTGDNPTESIASVNEESAITEAELALHNTRSDCWVAYNGIVYDVTDFIPEHMSPLTEFCGTYADFSSAYTGKHGISKDRKLAEFEIGTLG